MLSTFLHSSPSDQIPAMTSSSFLVEGALYYERDAKLSETLMLSTLLHFKAGSIVLYSVTLMLVCTITIYSFIFNKTNGYDKPVWRNNPASHVRDWRTLWCRCTRSRVGESARFLSSGRRYGRRCTVIVAQSVGTLGTIVCYTLFQVKHRFVSRLARCVGHTFVLPQRLFREVVVV